MTKYSIEAVTEHIRKKHPRCPDFAVAWFAAEIASKNWKGATLGKAVGITMQTHLRHLHTDYDTLLLTGIDREEARRRVQPRVNAMIGSWRRRKSTKTEEAQPIKGSVEDDGR
ncbi:DUF2293 domain-containing protein [Peteryoungia ipomoeae]|uniref:DUF2293 domain-containing protein n=1 Tax=Peteryoungia ipomoeae TaxID=1210932 RepID=A0A4S8NZ95_9HYPH|nr:DUF2293 domain-containing protein [Peteryoungia ipomoeae]THV23057.1 DUF2293 domain-containing protein [Peteryoungia ipomoeae]